MGQRYAVQEGAILRRSELPNGDVIVTLLSEASKWRAVARKGKLIGGNLGKLSLFHDVTVQHYTRSNGSDDLALITQVQLNGALPRLSDPAIYPYAHVLAELTDKLAVDVHLDGGFYEYFTGALRGLSSQPDPERVALAYTEDSEWRNRSEFFVGRAAIVDFLTRKWAKELDYKLIKEVWAFDQAHIAARFAYEWHDAEGNWFRSYGNEQWEFAENGLMKRREASINDVSIQESERKFLS